MPTYQYRSKHYVHQRVMHWSGKLALKKYKKVFASDRPTATTRVAPYNYYSVKWVISIKVKYLNWNLAGV